MDINEFDYPRNYNFLTRKQQKAILKNLNFLAENQEHLFYYIARLEKTGIFPRYNWAGHRNEWILATEKDAAFQREYLFQVTD